MVPEAGGRSKWGIIANGHGASFQDDENVNYFACELSQ